MSKLRIGFIGILFAVTGFLMIYEKTLNTGAHPKRGPSQNPEQTQATTPQLANPGSNSNFQSVKLSQTESSGPTERFPLPNPPMNPQGLNEGESFFYKGYKVVRMKPSDDEITGEDLLNIHDEWNQGLQDFVDHDISDSDLSVSDLKKAEKDAYGELETELGRISSEVYQKFGEGFAVASEGDLMDRRKSADIEYQAKLKSLMSSRDYEAYGKLRAHYQDIAFSRLKFVPDLIR